jgi:serine/threonine-protein kinase
MIGRHFLGRYEAIRLLGEGGMGRAFLARDGALGRQVVVKVMHDHIAADTKFRERFQRETFLMARFQHPHAVTLYDASLDDPLGPCIIMEYVRGVNLDALLAKNGRFTAPRVGRLLGQLCEVLQAAHDAGIIHRDLKPANLMVIDADSPREKLKVLDFGLAKPLSAGAMRAVTDANLEFAVGTPGYICPESVRGERVDHRGDIYSVGVILYELLTGRLPFGGDSSMDVLIAHATEPPPTFAEIGLESWVPEAIEAVVMDCLAKDADRRPRSARELAERFETALVREQAAQESASLPPPPPRPGSEPPRQSPVVNGLAPASPFDLVFQMEAWMPEKVALMKMRGFVQDAGGAVVESVPGLIRVRMGTTRPSRGSSPGLSPRRSWFGFARRDTSINMELQLIQPDPHRESSLEITVIFRPNDRSQALDPDWKVRCTQTYCEVRDYLMARTAGTG